MSKAKRLLAVMCSMALLLSGAVRTGHAVLAEEAEENLIPTEEVMSMEETSGQEEDVPAAETRVEENVSEVKQIAPEPEPAVAEEPVKQPSATEEAPAEDQKAPETTEPTAEAETASSEEEQETSKDVPSGEAEVIPEVEETSEEEPTGETQPEAQPATETETVIPNEDQEAVPEQEKPEGTTLVSEIVSDPVVQVIEPKEIPVVEVDGASADILIGSETTMVVLKSSAAGTVLVTLNRVPGLVLKGEDKKEVSPVGNADPDMLSYELKVRFGETEIFLSASTEATVNIQASLQKEPAKVDEKQTPVEKETALVEEPEQKPSDGSMEMPEKSDEQDKSVMGIEASSAPAEEAGETAEEKSNPSATIIEMETVSDWEELANEEEIAGTVIETEQVLDEVEALETIDETAAESADPSPDEKSEEEEGVETDPSPVEEIEKDLKSDEEKLEVETEFEQEMLNAGYIKFSVIRETGLSLYSVMDENAEAEGRLDFNEEGWAKPVEGIWAQLVDEENIEPVYFNLNNVMPMLGDIGYEVPARQVIVQSSLDGVTEIEEGAEVTMTALTSGIVKDEITEITWQYRIMDDPEDPFHDVEDAHNIVYVYSISEENAGYEWRVVLTLKS